MPYFGELQTFLTQSETNNLATSNYIQDYEDLTVRVSFGKGNQAQVPWIAFLREHQSVQKGIYPVYLYFKRQNLLILAFGVSETNTPPINWNLPNLKTIKDYFREKNLGDPIRYGNSFIFKDYNTLNPLNPGLIENDLTSIINIYKKQALLPPQESSLETTERGFEYKVFVDRSQSANLFILQKTCLRFAASLLTKPFVILTGLSGSGKTKLAQAFAAWICQAPSQYCIVPVGSDWTNKEPLLGFPNALKPEDYIKPDNRVLDLIIEAMTNPSKPYFLILDEMNLSHVERYFSDFLSVMESNNTICLHSGNKSWNNIPPEISIPPNFFIIGTVNIDETTYMFSPKVLDRSSVIEFRVSTQEMAAYLNNHKPLNLEILKSHGSNMANAFVTIAKDKTHQSINTSEINESLLLFFDELKKTGAEFGFRTAAEIIRMAGIVNKLEPDLTEEEIIDIAIMQKLLPKVHGSRKKLEPVLKVLGSFCLRNKETIDELISLPEIDYSDLNKIKYPISLEKISRMYQNVLSNGFTSYAEA